MRRRITRGVDLELDRRDAVTRDVDDEIAFHLRARVEQLVAQGYSRETAEALAVARFGPVEASRRELVTSATARSRHMHVVDRLEALRYDLSHSLRQLARSRLFSAAVIVTLGLGIGANAAVFGAIDQLLLRPPAHVVDPGRVVTVAFRDLHRDASHVQRVLSFPIYKDLQRERGTFTAVGISRGVAVDRGSGADVKPMTGLLANAAYFRALGTRPVLGRFFSDDEAGDASSAPVTVLGYDFWQRELGGDTGVLGRRLVISGTPHTVIGVAPEAFTGAGLAAVDAWLPLTDGMSAATIASLATQRQTYAYSVLARLAPGVSPLVAAAVATAALERGERADGLTDAQLREQGRNVELTSLLPREARRDVPEARVAELLGAVSLLVLLLTCANVMNLQLARGIRRRREVAVRVALGVDRARLLRQLALDCLLLSLLGGVVGVFVAGVGGRFMRATLLDRSVAALSSVDSRVLAFSIAAALFTGVLTGLIPAFDALRSDLLSALKEGARATDSARTSRIRVALLGVQGALTTVLLIGTGLFVLSLRRIEAVPLGFDPSHAAFARLNTTGRHSSPFSNDTEEEQARTREQFRRLMDVARATPGVTAAAVALTAPFEGGYARGIAIPGRDSTPVTREGGPYFNAVSGDYFNVIGTRIVSGRAFTASDQAAAPAVLIVNETAAALWWPGENPVGKCVRLGDPTDPCATVVGVVENTRRLKIVEDAFVQLFIPIDQASQLTPSVVLFRTAGSVENLIPVVQRRLQSASAGLPYVNVRPLAALIAPRMRAWTLGAAMFGAFACLALVLAAFGLYSVLAYDIAQRRQELGIRRALGASTGALVTQVVRRGLTAVGVGLAVGVGMAVAAHGVVAPLLFQTSIADVRIYALVVPTVAVVSLLATAFPAWTASRVNPSLALRGE